MINFIRRRRSWWSWIINSLRWQWPALKFPCFSPITVFIKIPWYSNVASKSIPIIFITTTSNLWNCRISDLKSFISSINTKHRIWNNWPSNGIITTCLKSCFSAPFKICIWINTQRTTSLTINWFIPCFYVFTFFFIKYK